MFKPDDPLAPPGEVFDEAWQAQVLAMADAMVRSGHFSAHQWAETLGAMLLDAEKAGEPDTLNTYYSAALAALEYLSAKEAQISQDEQLERKETWRRAYENTEHGQPVLISAGLRPT